MIVAEKGTETPVVSSLQLASRPGDLLGTIWQITCGFQRSLVECTVSVGHLGWKSMEYFIVKQYTWGNYYRRKVSTNHYFYIVTKLLNLKSRKQ